MKRHLFLSGPGFSGKSRLIRETLGTELEMAGGFCTELSTAPDGGLLGCSMLPAAMAGGAEGYGKELFLDLRKMPPAHDSEVFRNLGVRLLNESPYYPFAVLDEIGGIDLIIPQFREALNALLNTDLPILGVLKTEDESEQLRQILGVGERWLGFSAELHARLETEPGTEVLRIGQNAEADAQDTLRNWISEYVIPV